MAHSFDLFGTLVAVERPADPAVAVARELCEQGVTVPVDWEAAYAERHVDAPTDAEVPLPVHVAAVLRSRDIDFDPEAVRRAIIAAFDPTVETPPGAVVAVGAASDHGPVAVLSNCSVPGLVHRTLARSALDPGVFDAIVTSVACGWRKPNAGAFETVADRLGIDPTDLVHVGDDSRTDGGVADLGGRFVSVEGTSLMGLSTQLRGRA